MSLMKGLKWLETIYKHDGFQRTVVTTVEKFVYKSELNVKFNQNEFLNFLNTLKWNYKVILGSSSLYPQSVLEIREGKCQKEFGTVNVRSKY